MFSQFRLIPAPWFCKFVISFVFHTFTEFYRNSETSLLQNGNMWVWVQFLNLSATRHRDYEQVSCERTVCLTTTGIQNMLIIYMEVMIESHWNLSFWILTALYQRAVWHIRIYNSIIQKSIALAVNRMWIYLIKLP